MTVFTDSLGVFFRDPNGSVPAEYSPPGGGAAVLCRITWITQGDHDYQLFTTGATAPARVAEVQVSEVALMEEGGTVATSAGTFAIVKASRPDADRSLWRLELA